MTPQSRRQQLVVSALLGADRADVPLLHGEHPRAAALRAAARFTHHPLQVVGPPEVDSVVADDPAGSLHTLRIGYRLDRVAGAAAGDPGVADLRPSLRDLPQVQRAAAYAVIVEAGRLLLTRLTASPVWTLPGGGIEHGETPVEAAVREVYEEAGLVLQPGPLLDVDSIHFTGQAPDGRWEDYHGVRVVYAGSVPVGAVPRVIEVDGTTEEAAWIGRGTLGTLKLSGLARVMTTPEVLDRLAR